MEQEELYKIKVRAEQAHKTARVWLLDQVIDEDVPALIAEIERLRQFTNPKLFAAASYLLEAWEVHNNDRFSEIMEEEAIPLLAEAVAWWDSLPFDPTQDTEKLPKYEEQSPISHSQASGDKK